MVTQRHEKLKSESVILHYFHYLIVYNISQKIDFVNNVPLRIVEKLKIWLFIPDLITFGGLIEIDYEYCFNIHLRFRSAFCASITECVRCMLSCSSAG